MKIDIDGNGGSWRNWCCVFLAGGRPFPSQLIGWRPRLVGGPADQGTGSVSSFGPQHAPGILALNYLPAQEQNAIVNALRITAACLRLRTPDRASVEVFCLDRELVGAATSFKRALPLPQLPANPGHLLLCLPSAGLAGLGSEAEPITPLPSLPIPSLPTTPFIRH